MSSPAASPGIVAYVFLDMDLVTHDHAEGAIEAELSQVYAELGTPLTPPDPGRLKGRHNYVGRIIATIASCGIYGLWWLYDLMVEGNRHFEHNWRWEDSLAAAVQSQLGVTPAAELSPPTPPPPVAPPAPAPPYEPPAHARMLRRRPRKRRRPGIAATRNAATRAALRSAAVRVVGARRATARVLGRTRRAASGSVGRLLVPRA